MKVPRINKFSLVFHPALWLALALAVVSTSCATTGGNSSYSTGGSGPVKGGTLLMQH